MPKDKPTSKSKKKNESETKTVSDKDTVKDPKQTSTKKPNSEDGLGKPSSGAGKGDKLRRGITQYEWGKKWEKIFGLNGEVK